MRLTVPAAVCALALSCARPAHITPPLHRIAPSPDATPAERAHDSTSATYDAMLAFVRTLAQRVGAQDSSGHVIPADSTSARIQVWSFGNSSAGRVIPYVIAARPMVGSAAAAVRPGASYPIAHLVY